MKIVSFLSIFLACTGCMNQTKIDRIMAEMPSHMRGNIGPVKYEPFSPLSLILAGQVVETDPSATIHLYAFANDDVLRHEAFHSFELLAMQNRPLEWQKYCLCMGNTETKLTSRLAYLLPVPPQWLPSESSGTVYGEMNHYEEGAETFVHHQPERKWDCVCRFAHGIPQNRPHLMQIARKGPSDWTVLSFLQRNFRTRVSSNQGQQVAKEEPTTMSKIWSFLRSYFVDRDVNERYRGPFVGKYVEAAN